MADANETAVAFTNVAVKLTQLAMSLAGDVRMLKQLDEAGEVGAMEELTEAINAKLEVFEDLKLIKAIDTLSETLKIKKAKKASAKEIAIQKKEQQVLQKEVAPKLEEIRKEKKAKKSKSKN